MLKQLSTLLIFILLISSAYAVDYYVEFQSIETLEPIHKSIAYFHGEGNIFNKYLYEDEPVLLSINNQTSKLAVRVDSIDSQGSDYFTLIDINQLSYSTDNEVNVILLSPVASLRGIVKDSLGNILAGAKLKFECNNIQSTFLIPEETDEFGGFFVELLPTGECKIHATSGNSVGSTTVNLEQGDLQEIEIQLDGSVVLEDNQNNTLFFLIALLLILIILISTYMFYKSKKLSKQIQQTKQDQEQLTKQTKTPPKQSKRLDSIIKTLNQKESSIITLLKDREANTELQSKIRHELGIPRTTLSRLLQSLEKKKIITMSKQGKIVKIKLTDWILEQE